MGKLVLSHVKMMSSISSIKLVRNKSLVDIIVEVHHFDAVAPARERGLKYGTRLDFRYSAFLLLPSTMGVDSYRKSMAEKCKNY